MSLADNLLAKDIKVDGLLSKATDVINQAYQPKELAAVPALSNY